MRADIHRSSFGTGVAAGWDICIRAGKSIGTRVAYILIDGLPGIRSIVASVGKTAIVWGGDSVGFTGGAIV